MAWEFGQSRRGSQGWQQYPQAFESAYAPAFARIWAQSSWRAHHSLSWWAPTRGTWDPFQTPTAPTGRACMHPPRPGSLLTPATRRRMSTPRHTPQDVHLHQCRCENLKSRTISFFPHIFASSDYSLSVSSFVCVRFFCYKFVNMPWLSQLYEIQTAFLTSAFNVLFIISHSPWNWRVLVFTSQLASLKFLTFYTHEVWHFFGDYFHRALSSL